MEVIQNSYIFLFVIIGFLIGFIVANLILNNRVNALKEIAYKDEILEVPNQKMLFRILEKEINYCKKYFSDFTFILFDVDNFKQMNTKYGYHKSNLLLKDMITLVKTSIRGTDLICRYQYGDEFAIFIRNTTSNIKNTLLLSERIRSKIEDEDFLIRDKSTKKKYVKLTVSMGIIQFSQLQTYSLKELLYRAEFNLLRAKKKKNSLYSGE